MLIILEGPDGVGKTTLAKVLASKLTMRGMGELKMWHKGPPTQHPLDEYVTPLLDYQPRSGVDIICDRWHWGEYVYPHVLGRETKMDMGVFEYIELFLQSRAALVVYMTRSYDNIRKVLRKRGDTLIDERNAAVVMDQYSRVTTVSKMSFIHGHYNDLTPDFSWDKIALRIIHLAENLEDTWNVELTGLRTYVGSPWPKTLLLGDVRNDPARQTSTLAFGPMPATSGHYLLNATRRTLHSSSYGIANACDVDDLDVLMKTLNPTRVVTLGDNAHERLRAGDWAHGAVLHPQYVRRFHHRHQEHYAHLIDQAAHSGRDLRSWRPS